MMEGLDGVMIAIGVGGPNITAATMNSVEFLGVKNQVEALATHSPNSKVVLCSSSELLLLLCFSPGPRLMRLYLHCPFLTIYALAPF